MVLYIIIANCISLLFSIISQPGSTITTNLLIRKLTILEALFCSFLWLLNLFAINAEEHRGEESSVRDSNLFHNPQLLARQEGVVFGIRQS